METLCAIKMWLVWGAIAASVMAFFVALTFEKISEAYRRSSKWQRVAFFLALIAATIYGGNKGVIVYPYTDPSKRYLVDTGSYVTNDYVHISFSRNILVPNTASFFLDRCEVCYTNAEEIVEHTVNSYSNTFANLPTIPFNHLFAQATNYNWFAYTDWTPPPVVHTNGVAYVVWQIGANKSSNVLVTTRTGIYTNSVRLAPNPAITNLPPLSPTLSTTQTEN